MTDAPLCEILARYGTDPESYWHSPQGHAPVTDLYAVDPSGLHRKPVLAIHVMDVEVLFVTILVVLYTNPVHTLPVPTLCILTTLPSSFWQGRLGKIHCVYCY